jgi:hypothetical protein
VKSLVKEALMRAIFLSVLFVAASAVLARGQIFDVTFNELAPGLALTQPVTDPLPLKRPTNVLLDFPDTGDTIEIVSDAGDLMDQPVLLEARTGGLSWGGFLTPEVYTAGTFSVSWDSLVMSLPDGDDPEPVQGVQLVTRTGDPGMPETLQIYERWEMRYSPQGTFEVFDRTGIRTAGSYNVGQSDHFDLDFNLATGHWNLDVNDAPLLSGTIVPPYEFGGIVFTTNGRGSASDPAGLVMDNLLVEPVAAAGDYNGNGMVEQADLDLVLLHWGNPTPPAPSGWIVDLPTGAIDQAELDGVLLNWGATAAGVSAPEPSTVTLAALLASLAACWRARHKKNVFTR